MTVIKYEYEKRLGYRRQGGTDWPIDVVVYRAGRAWVVATLCNGIAESSRTFRRKSDAVAYAQEAK